MNIAFVNQMLSVSIIGGQVLILLLLVSFVAKRATPFLAFFEKNALLIAFLIALGAMLGSLFYSEIAGYEPCTLCWYQRIFMYPQAFLFGLAVLKKDRNVFSYGILLSSIGAAIALYHYLLQLGVAPAIPCSAIDYSAVCSQRFVIEFNYITIPMMSLTTFLLVLLVCLSGKRATVNN